MLFNSVEFLLFFPAVVLVYYCIPSKIRYFWLLAASYFFYMNWKPAYGMLLFSCTLVTYLCGRILEEDGYMRRKIQGCGRKLCLVICILVNLGLLAFFKYSYFAASIINRILSLFSSGQVGWEADAIVLPVGISFYILQSLGYVIDVYRKEIHAEKNFFRYALFVSFFPQLVAGPIERSKNLLTQLANPAGLSFELCKKGLYFMLWGFFVKLVIADRAAIFVDAVYENSEVYPGLYIVLATILFALQIYCDFYGYSTIAKGAALFFGIRLMDNFHAPYYSTDVKEFWRRWHISLSSWFRDYLYIPLGGSRKGFIRKQINRLIVFTVSGLWHGASFAFITWGLLNGIYQVASDIREVYSKRKSKVCEKKDIFSSRLIKRAGTFGLVCFSWIFFRAGDMSDALLIIKRIFCFNWEILVDGSLYGLGITDNFFRVLLCAMGILFYVDYKKYKGSDMMAALVKQKWWFQIGVAAALLFVILLYGCYGVEYDTNQFIYFQF